MQDNRLERSLLEPDAIAAIGELGGERVRTATTLHAPVRNLQAEPVLLVRNRLCRDLLFVLETASREIGDGQVGLIDRLRLVRKIELEKYELVAIKMWSAKDVESPQVPAEIPPFGFIVVWG